MGKHTNVTIAGLHGKIFNGLRYDEEAYEKKLRNIICAIIAICVIIVSIFVYRINKYKIPTEEEQIYISAIEEYESIQIELKDISDQIFCRGKYQDQKALQYKDIDGYEMIFNDRYLSLRSKENELRLQLFDIEFPKKYQDMYHQLCLLDYINNTASDMAYESIDYILDEVKTYFPDSSIGRKVNKLKKQLYNEYYIPKEIDSSMYEQLFYRITTDWYDVSKVASRSTYLEFRDLIHHEDFLKSLK